VSYAFLSLIHRGFPVLKSFGIVQTSRSQPQGFNMNEISQEFPSQEQIARRAYEIYVARGSSDGQDLADWLMAEQELRASALVQTGSEPVSAKSTSTAMA
jgi:hypothetical protein